MCHDAVCFIGVFHTRSFYKEKVTNELVRTETTFIETLTDYRSTLYVSALFSNFQESNPQSR